MAGAAPPALAVVFAVMVSAATGASAAAGPPRFASQSEIVTVDALVLDSDGQPVHGLTRDDFVVKEDGRPQPLSRFEAVEAIVPALASPVAVAAPPSQARLATNVSGPPTRRTFAIVFDDLHVGDVNVEQAKRAVAAFVARQTTPGDRLVLATVSDARFWATTRGGEDASWRDALAGVRSHALVPELTGCRVTHYEAMRIEEFNDAVVAERVKRRLDLLCPEDRLLADAEQAVRRAAPAGTGSAGNDRPTTHALIPKIGGTYAQARTQLGKALRVVREVVRSLGATPGRKALVLVTEGFPLDPSLDAFREVKEQAARANVVVHFLDARGLATGPEFLSAAGVTSAIPAQDLGPTLALWKLEDAGAKALAEETGGLVLQTNDLASGLAKVADESRVTYLLGYEPTNAKRDGRYRRLSVELRRPGLTVRSRAGYFAAKRDERPAVKPTPVQQALGDLFDADAIPLRLAAYVMGPAPVQSPVPKTGYEVLIAGEMRLDALASRVQDGRLVAEPRLKLVASSREGESHESEWTLDLVLSPSLASGAAAAVQGAPAAGESLWHPFVTRIAMGPGDHRARLVVQSGERIGSVTVDFLVPATGSERLSSPILSDRLVPGGAERRLLPLARRVFLAGGTLHCWIELYGASLDAASQPRATVAFAARTGGGREWASGAAAPMTADGGRPSRLVSLPLADAPAGEHELVLRVRDELSGASFEVREPFRVEAAP